MRSFYKSRETDTDRWMLMVESCVNCSCIKSKTREKEELFGSNLKKSFSDYRVLRKSRKAETSRKYCAFAVPFLKQIMEQKLPFET